MLSEQQNVDRVADSDSSIVGSWSTAIKSRFSIGKEKAKLVNDIDLALKEINNAESLDATAEINTEDGIFSIEQIRGWAYFQKGLVNMFSGSLKQAEKYYKEALTHVELPDTYYYLALVYEDLKRPGPACQMYQQCIDFYNDYSEADDFDKQILLDARKQLNRLQSKKILGGWFVGSWKVLATLSVLVLIFIVSPYDDPQNTRIPLIVIFGAITAFYLWRKWRK